MNIYELTHEAMAQCIGTDWASAAPESDLYDMGAYIVDAVFARLIAAAEAVRPGHQLAVRDWWVDDGYNEEEVSPLVDWLKQEQGRDE